MVEHVEIVAEFTTNHLGNLNLLLRMVDAAADAGADCIKMQAKDVESFYSQEKLGAPYASPYGTTYRDYRTLFEFGENDWVRFDTRCKQRGIRWFATAQDAKSQAFLAKFGPTRHKIASSNARNWHFLETVAREVPPDHEVVLSVAGSTLPEIEKALGILDDFRCVWLLHCVAEYPCKPEHLRLGNIRELRRRFACERVKVGYSGHEVGYSPTLAAVQAGAEMVERHFCLSRHSFTHHIECSLEPAEFAAMVKAIREGWADVALPGGNQVEFGMSDMERSFLVDQTYGNEYLGQQSTM